MSFGGGSGGSGSISGSTDVALSSPTNTQVLTYNATLGKWQNQAATASDTSKLAIANNLSDVASAATARINLGLAAVATTGSYTDLTNKPTIPAVTGTNTGDQTLSLAASTLTISGSNGNSVTLPAGATLDTTAGDIQPLGTQAAGSTGKAADASHVHAMPRLDQVNAPTAAVALNAQQITGLANGAAATDAAAYGQLPVAGTTGSTYAAGNDSRITGAIQASTVTTKGDLLAATGANTVVRLGVGSDSQLLLADSSQTSGVKWGSLAAGSLATVTNQQGQPLVLGASGALSWGYPWQFNILGYGAKGDGTTDDTIAIQSAINAAVTYAQSNGGYCEVIVPPTSAYYAINGALQQGGSTLGNSQITLPVIDTNTTPTNMKVTIVIKGVENATGQYHWKQSVMQKTGATLVSNGTFASAATQLTSVNNNGHPVVIGGPTQKNGYGTSALKFSNMLVVIKGLNIVTALSTGGLNYGAMDFTGLAQAQILDSQWGQNTTYLNTWQNAGNISTLGGGLSVGLVMPAAGNNDNNLIRNCVVTGGFQRGVIFTEHTVIERLASLYCYTSLSVVGSSYLVSPPGALHAIVGDQISAEGYHTLLEVIGPGQGGVGPIMDLHIDTEGTPIFAGTGFAAALGTIYMAGTAPASFTVPTTGLKIVQEYRAIGSVATPSFTLGTAFLNPYWHDAFVQIAGGTVTAIKQGATLAGTAAPTMNDTHLTSGMFLIPAGGWLEIDGSVAPTVNNWTLI